MPRPNSLAASSQKYKPDDLAALLEGMADRDRQAFPLLYRATSPALLGVVLDIVKKKDVAEAILQEVYIKIWEQAEDYEPAGASPMEWMAAIARDCAHEDKTQWQAGDGAKDAGDVKSKPEAMPDLFSLLEQPQTSGEAPAPNENSGEVKKLEPSPKVLKKIAWGISFFNTGRK